MFRGVAVRKIAYAQVYVNTDSRVGVIAGIGVCCQSRQNFVFNMNMLVAIIRVGFRVKRLSVNEFGEILQMYLESYDADVTNCI